MGVSLRKRVNWERETYAGFGCHQPIGWDPGLNRNKKGERHMSAKSQMCASILLCLPKHADGITGSPLRRWPTPNTTLFLTWWTLSSSTMSLKTSFPQGVTFCQVFGHRETWRRRKRAFFIEFSYENSQRLMSFWVLFISAGWVVTANMGTV